MAAAFVDLNDRVNNIPSPYEYYKANGGYVSERAYSIMTKYLFTPFMISSTGPTSIPDELMNDSKTSFFTDCYWNFMRITGGEPIKTIQWDGDNPLKFVGMVSGDIYNRLC